MKVLLIHADHMKFEPKKKAISSAEDIKKGEVEVKECLVVFSSVEKRDEADPKKVAKTAVEEIEKVSKLVNTKKIVVYPFVHLTSDPSSPKTGLEVLKDIEASLKKRKYDVVRSPFGYYKSFEVSCKGHPLSELSRSFSAEGKVKQKELTKEEVKALLKTVSRSKLDTAKLKENDHRIIGQNLDLWSFNDVAPGMVFWHNNGLFIKNKLIEYWREVHQRENYEEISTPQIMDKKLWQVSGHWDKYSENNFVTKYEKRDFLVKPMNCPGGMLVYKTSPKSYRDLPLRVGELGIVHRQELSGVLAGLFRVVQFTQDDAHIFCTEKQMEGEVGKIIDLIIEMFDRFNLEFDHVELSTRPEKRIGSDAVWDKAEKSLENVLKKRKMKYQINKGDGAFYGPKIDFHLKDSLGRTWQCSTIQLDMALPERFELEYIDEKGNAKRPVMLHRVVYGAIERFIGILTEHLNGKFPLWLNPKQVTVMTLTDRNIKFAQKIVDQLKAKGIRADLDDRTETMGKKVRDAQMQKVNYMVTIGDKEEEKGVLAVRSRAGKVKFDVKVNDFINDLLDEINKKELK